MRERFEEYIRQHDLAGKDDHILIAVSGGLDSMVLTHLFRESGYKVGVAHANFGLREKESDGDEAFVKDYCKKHSLAFFSKRFDTKNYAESHKVSVQMAARELRYAWFDECMTEGKYHWLATAHNLNDNIETVLMRMLNGGGLDQLTGIPRKNDRTIRPLLFASREEIASFASAVGINWREDSSNHSTQYQRNFIRHEVLPKLCQINPSLESTFSSGLEKMEGARELMRRGLEQLRDSMTRMEDQSLVIDRNLLLLLQHPGYVLYEWLRDFGFEFERCKQMAVAAAEAQTGARFLSVTHVALIDRETILVSPRDREVYHDVLVEEWQDKAALGPWVMHFHAIQGSEISADPYLATVDFSAVKFPLLWRRWKAGDSFVPLGMKKSKKVSDFLVDEQVPLTEKASVTVVMSGNEIVWVAGKRIDERFKVTPQTRTILTMRLSPHK